MKYYLWLFRKYLSRLIFREFSILVYREKKGGLSDGLSGMMSEEEYIHIDLKGHISIKNKEELTK
jgi:hypothetical protein